MVSADDIARAARARRDDGEPRARLLELRPEAAPAAPPRGVWPAPAADIGDPFGEEQPADDDCLATMAPLLGAAIDIESGRLVESAQRSNAEVRGGLFLNAWLCIGRARLERFLGRAFQGPTCARTPALSYIGEATDAAVVRRVGFKQSTRATARAAAAWAVPRGQRRRGAGGGGTAARGVDRDRGRGAVRARGPLGAVDLGGRERPRDGICIRTPPAYARTRGARRRRRRARTRGEAHRPIARKTAPAPRKRLSASAGGTRASQHAPKSGAAHGLGRVRAAQRARVARAPALALARAHTSTRSARSRPSREELVGARGRARGLASGMPHVPSTPASASSSAAAASARYEARARVSIVRTYVAARRSPRPSRRRSRSRPRGAAAPAAAAALVASAASNRAVGDRRLERG